MVDCERALKAAEDCIRKDTTGKKLQYLEQQQERLKKKQQNTTKTGTATGFLRLALDAHAFVRASDGGKGRRRSYKKRSNTRKRKITLLSRKKSGAS